MLLRLMYLICKARGIVGLQIYICLLCVCPYMYVHHNMCAAIRNQLSGTGSLLRCRVWDQTPVFGFAGKNFYLLLHLSRFTCKFSVQRIYCGGK